MRVIERNEDIKIEKSERARVKIAFSLRLQSDVHFLQSRLDLFIFFFLVCRHVEELCRSPYGAIAI